MHAHFQFGLRQGRTLTLILAVAVGGALVVWAADAPANIPAAAAATAATATGNDAASENSQLQADNDLGTLEMILRLSPQRLAALSKALENVEKMPQAERDALLREIQNRRVSIRRFDQENSSDIKQLSPPDNSVFQQYLLTLYPNEIEALSARFHAAATPEERAQIVQEVLKTATSKGIKPQLIPRGGTPGGRGGRGGAGTGASGRDSSRRGDDSHPPMPTSAPVPLPAQ